VRFILYLFIFSFMFPLYVHAQTTELYRVNIPIQQRDNASQTKAFQKALQHIMVRLHGQSKIIKNSRVQKSLKRAEEFVQKFAYEDGRDDLILVIDFESDAVNTLMQELKLPIWYQPRPQFLTWIMIDDEKSKRFINQDTAPEAANLLLDAAKQRGINTLFPVLDLEDMTTVKFDDVKQNNQTNLLKAAQRYGVNIMLAGWINKDLSDHWTAQWHLYLENEPTSWEIQAEKLVEVIQKGVNKAVDETAAQLAQPVAVVETFDDGEMSNSTYFELVVTNVNNFSEYSKTVQYLNGLDAITDMEIRSVRPGQVRFAITAPSGEIAVRRAISAGRVFSPHNLLGEETTVYQLVR